MSQHDESTSVSLASKLLEQRALLLFVAAFDDDLIELGELNAVTVVHIDIAGDARSRRNMIERLLHGITVGLHLLEQVGQQALVRPGHRSQRVEQGEQLVGLVGGDIEHKDRHLHIGRRLGT